MKKVVTETELKEGLTAIGIHKGMAETVIQVLQELVSVEGAIMEAPLELYGLK